MDPRSSGTAAAHLATRGRWRVEPHPCGHGLQAERLVSRLAARYLRRRPLSPALSDVVRRIPGSGDVDLRPLARHARGRVAALHRRVRRVALFALPEQPAETDGDVRAAEA